MFDGDFAQVPAGEGLNNRLIVTVFNQTSDAIPFSYNPPVVTEMVDITGNELVWGDCCKYVGLVIVVDAHSLLL